VTIGRLRKQRASGTGACEKIVEAPGGDESRHPHQHVVVDSGKLRVVRPRIDRRRLGLTRPEGERVFLHPFDSPLPLTDGMDSGSLRHFDAQALAHGATRRSNRVRHGAKQR
jgi:hypothetical protein